MSSTDFTGCLTWPVHRYLGIRDKLLAAGRYIVIQHLCRRYQIFDDYFIVLFLHAKNGKIIMSKLNKYIILYKFTLQIPNSKHCQHLRFVLNARETTL